MASMSLGCVAGYNTRRIEHSGAEDRAEINPTQGAIVTEVIEAVAASSGPVADDLPCYRCGYNVRGLALDGRCPECAAEVDETRRRLESHRDGQTLPLAESDPRWVRTLAWACVWVLVGGLLLIPPQIISLMEWDLPVALGMMIAIGPFMALFAGGWMSARREPVHAGRRRVWLRGIIRGGVIGWVVSVASLILTILAGDWPHLISVIGLGVSSAVLSWGFFWRMRELALRLGRPRIVWACTALSILAPLASAAMFVPGIGEIEYRFAHVQMLLPTPILGEGLLLVLLPYSLAQMPRFDAATAAHTAIAGIALTVLITVALLCRALFRAAALARTAPSGGL